MGGATLGGNAERPSFSEKEKGMLHMMRLTTRRIIKRQPVLNQNNSKKGKAPASLRVVFLY